MNILVDAVPDRGYTITSEIGEERSTFPRTCDSLLDALDYALILASLTEKVTGQAVEPLVSASAIRTNKDKDVAARRVWKNMAFRVE